MRLRTLALSIMLVVLLPFSLAILIGFFVDYTEPSNSSLLRAHPGYYYHADTGGSGGVIVFRGGGPDFGK